MTAGRFLVVEGGDGAGKSTQVDLLAAALRAAGWTVTVTREPGGTELGLAIRGLLLHGGDVAARAEALLYAADRAEHVERVIRPALERDDIVVADRYVDSSIAYQVEGRGLAESEVRAINDIATGGLRPDLTILLDITAADGAARLASRGRVGVGSGGSSGENSSDVGVDASRGERTRDGGRSGDSPWASGPGVDCDANRTEFVGAGPDLGADADRIERAGADFHARVNARYRALAEVGGSGYVRIEAAAPPLAIHALIWAAVSQLLEGGRPV